jgi:hypothetical protein
MAMTRGGFLRLGASGVAAAAGTAFGAGTVLAAPPPATPVGDDYQVDFPKDTFSTRDKAVALGIELEKPLVGVYVSGAGYSADPGTRLLISRLLTVDGQLLGTLRMMIGRPVADGVPIPLDTEQAGDALDKLITVPGSPGGG